MLIGEQRAVSDLWEAARKRLSGAREDRPGQPVYAISAPPEPGGTGLRPATLSDLELLVPACARAHEGELGIDPLRRDADGFRWRTRAQIDEGRSWLWEEDGVILFKAEASAWTPQAVQLQQVWTDPEARGRRQRGPRAARPDPAAARAGADRLPLRPRRQRGGDRALRQRRDEPRPRLPERAPVRELVVARHAESEFNVLERLNGDPSVEVVLTEAGRAQARALGEEAGPVDLAGALVLRADARDGGARVAGHAAARGPRAGRVHVRELRGLALDGGVRRLGRDRRRRTWARRAGARAASRRRAASSAATARCWPAGGPDRLRSRTARPWRTSCLRSSGKPPARVLEGVEQARPFTIAAAELDRALDVIDAWVASPRF